ncbi:MAG: hypothetical protein COW55_09680 [Rhodobacteraceae bacterium CG17_big_fil_post_rev_8_21_14_2_50_65_11]|nr:MAG: hypothetical protein COW55_09680 [Rhodobacteraceae bacterium CG17_big_fil_post_rev_8_21_14_2_50_65_11]
MHRLSLVVLAGTALAVLSACEAPPPEQPTQRPAAPVAEQPTVAPSDTSIAFARYYGDVQQRLLTQGLLRTDGGGSDTPIIARNLVANFERIALYDEYALSDGRFVAQQTPAALRRWERPVRLQAHFGASVPHDQRDEDRARLARYGDRLSGITGHPIRAVGSGGNFHVLFLNRDEQRDAGPLLRRIMPNIGAATIREITTLPRHEFCAVYAISAASAPHVYVAAIAFIRAEHPDLMRRSCLHEEVAQGLGLPNDSPLARPSIFNDDEEFALLTRHDELLLRMLYDPRLSPGMTPAEARPVLQQLAQGLVGGPS